MVAQCLGLCTLTVSGSGSIPGLGTKTPQALGHSEKEKKKKKEGRKKRNPHSIEGVLIKPSLPQKFL